MNRESYQGSKQRERNYESNQLQGKRQNCILIVSKMNGEVQQNQLQFELMYNQLMVKYANLASNYHSIAQENLQLYSEVERLMEQKISLMQEQVLTQVTLPLQPSLLDEQSQIQELVSSEEKEEIQRQSRRHRSKRNSSKLYHCTYIDCSRIYKSSVSMNLHIKLKHNGGTKRQREALAKILIDSEERGEPRPQSTLNLPPNFLQEFRKTYEYTKKYNM